jgi:predicted HicB family RNase H-like nuclease
MPIPEEKAVFTVKLPRSLIRLVRHRARQSEKAISDWVAAALQQALPANSAHG